MRNALRLTVLLLLSTLTAAAQGYINDMSVYQAETTDGTNVTVSSVADGSYSMSQIPPGYPPNFIHHTTYSRAVLTSASGATNTGTSSTTLCPSCYASVTSTAELPIGSDDDWDFDWYDSVTCSIAGVVFSGGGTPYIGIRLTIATFKLVTALPDGSANYALACPGTSKATCGQPNYHGRAPYNWAEMYGFYTTIGGQSSGECTPLQAVLLTNGPPAPQNCQ
jgi:hypothetical protein